MNDRKLFKWVLVILALPVVIAAGCNDRYRYACQDPKNWDKEICKPPICEVHRNCPEYIFKEDATTVGVKNDVPKPVLPKTTNENSCNKGCENGK